GPRCAWIISSGAVVYSDLLEHCHLRGFRYSSLGLRDGLLAQMAAEHGSTASSKQIESERRDSIQAAVKHYRVDISHALQVRDSAVQLFDRLKSVHRLPPQYRENVPKASLLLRLARAFHLARSGAVQSVGVRVHEASIEFRLSHKRRMGVDLELWAIEKEKNYFREVFGRTLSVALA